MCAEESCVERFPCQWLGEGLALSVMSGSSKTEFDIEQIFSALLRLSHGRAAAVRRPHAEDAILTALADSKKRGLANDSARRLAISAGLI